MQRALILSGQIIALIGNDAAPPGCVVALVADTASVGDLVRPATHGDVTTERDRRMSQFPYAGKLYQFDADGQTNVSGAANLALAAIIQGAKAGDTRWSDPDRDFAWLATDNSVVPMDAQTMLAFATAAAAWKRDHIYAARAIKDLEPIPADYADDARWPK